MGCLIFHLISIDFGVNRSIFLRSCMQLQTQNTVYEIVSDMSTRQDSLEDRLTSLEDKLGTLQEQLDLLPDLIASRIQAQVVELFLIFRTLRVLRAYSLFYITNHTGFPPQNNVALAKTRLIFHFYLDEKLYTISSLTLKYAATFGEERKYFEFKKSNVFSGRKNGAEAEFSASGVGRRTASGAKCTLRMRLAWARVTPHSEAITSFYVPKLI